MYNVEALVDEEERYVVCSKSDAAHRREREEYEEALVDEKSEQGRRSEEELHDPQAPEEG
jgi:hypothetical protein